MRILRAGKCQGYSLIEQAAVLPILLAFIFGAIDVNRILHAYTAMEAGVDSALRCVYPVDGKCISVRPDAREALYKVSLSEGTPVYHTTTYDYSALASWLELPSYTHDHFNSRILDDLSVSMSDYLIRAVKPYYAVSADYGYWIRTFESPYFSGDALDGEAKYGANGSSVSPHKTVSLSAIDLASDGTRTGYVDFKVASPVSSASSAANNFLCFESSKVGTTGTHSPSFKKSCESGSLFSWNDPTNEKELTSTGHIVFHITGSAQAARSTTGSVAISLVYPLEDDPADRKKVDLGGRLIAQGGSGNFVPRGVPAGMVDPDTNTYSEFDNYQSIKIPYGKTIRLKFTLEDKTGTGKYSWSGDKLRIWLPQYTYKSGTTPCADALAELDKNNLSKCKPTDTTWADPAVLLKSVPTNKIVKSTKLDLGCDQLIDPKTELTALVKDAANYVTTEKVNSNQCPGFSKTKFSCSAANIGIARNSNPSNSELVKTCGAAIKYNGQTIDPAKLTLIAKTKDVSQAVAPIYSWKPTDCSNLGIPASTLSKLAGNYKDWWFDTPIKAGGGYQIFTGSKTPAEFKKNHSELACTEVSTQTALYDQGSALKIGTESIFSGERDELCGDWKQVLRDEALKLGLNGQSYFEARAKVLNSSTTEFKQAGSCYRSSFKPSDTAPKELGIFPSTSLPAECSDTGKHCSLSYAGLTDDAPGETLINLEAAATEVGFSAIKAAMPSARLACQGQDCVKIEVKDDAGVMRAQASTEIKPLLLFGKSISINYSNFRTREDQYAR